MTNSHLIQVADAVLSVLEGASLSLSFSGSRAYAPKYRLENLAELTLAVRPAGDKSTIMARGIVGHLYTIEVAILKQVADTAAATIDPLTAFTEEIAVLFLGKRFSARSEVCTDAAVIIYDLPALSQATEFKSLVTLQFQGER